MSNQDRTRSAAEVRRVFELLDNVDTVADGDNFKYGMQVGKLAALGWVLGEVATSDLALQYEYEDWIRDVAAQEESLKRQIKDLKGLLDDGND